MDLTYYDLIRIPSPECEECAGTGESETLVRWRYDGMGGPEPVYRIRDCECCYGTGLEGCSEHPEEALIAHSKDEPGIMCCAQCIAAMIEDLERTARKDDPSWDDALAIQETTEALRAMLEAYEMEVET